MGLQRRGSRALFGGDAWPCSQTLLLYRCPGVGSPGRHPREALGLTGGCPFCVPSRMQFQGPALHADKTEQPHSGGSAETVTSTLPPSSRQIPQRKCSRKSALKPSRHVGFLLRPAARNGLRLTEHSGTPRKDTWGSAEGWPWCLSPVCCDKGGGQGASLQTLPEFSQTRRELPLRGTMSQPHTELPLAL